MEIQSNVLKIEKNIWETFNNENRIGLLDGLSGFIMFYDKIFQAYPNEEFENKLLTIIEKANKLIEEEQISINLCSGLSGYGLALLRLKNKNIEISEEYFEGIDSILLEDFELHCESNQFDFLHEAMGVAMYFIERYLKNKNENIIKILKKFSEDFIEKINLNFKNVLIKKDEDRGDYYSLGLAHGAASYLNFLIYLKTNFKELTLDINKPLRICVDFLHSYKKYDNQSKQFYTNYIPLGDNKAIPSRLSWCQGDLGVSNALYNTGTYLNDKSLIDEAIALMNHCASISFEYSGVNDFGFCHGSAGILAQFYLASKKYKNDYALKINSWYDTLIEQTNDFEVFQWFDNSTNQYKSECNLLVGTIGLGLVLLTIENKIDCKWLEIFNLH